MLTFADRLLTIVVTATLTSAVWVVAGSGFVLDRRVGSDPSQAARSAAPPAHPVVAAAPITTRAGELIVPVSGVAPDRLSDTFSDARGGGQRLHEALDIMAPAGTPVVAAADGTVEKLFVSKAGGNTVYVRSPDRRTIYYYAHLQNYRPDLNEGQAVKRGEPLGTVGATGNADPTAPHLHFAIMRTTADAQWWDPATAINPFPLLRRGER